MIKTHEASFAITQYLIRLYAKKHNVPLIKLKNIKHRRCAYCLGTVKEKGYMHKFRENKIVLHRCINCTWKLGICKIRTDYLKKGYKLKDYGIWSNSNTLRKHKLEIMKKYEL